jgi:hypothetical protein
VSAEPLWEEPSWTESWPIRTAVLSTYTQNRGVVVGVRPGRHLLIEWQSQGGRDGYVVRHSSDQGLRKVEP